MEKEPRFRTPNAVMPLIDEFVAEVNASLAALGAPRRIFDAEFRYSAKRLQAATAMWQSSSTGAPTCHGLYLSGSYMMESSWLPYPSPGTWDELIEQMAKEVNKSMREEIIDACMP